MHTARSVRSRRTGSLRRPRRSVLRGLLASAIAIGSLTPAVAAAGDFDDAVVATSHTPEQYIALFDDADLPGLAAIGPAPAITGDAALDGRIRAIGEARGYQRRPEPGRALVSVGGHMLQPEAADGWTSLHAAAADAGHSISITSAYRGAASQASILRGRLSGTSDTAIDQLLQTVAVPGYSKHHTGYAIDIRTPDGTLFAFRDTAAYAWLVADDFANAKAHGWVPSYPDGGGSVGPNPEPWEFVWVGAVNILCGDFAPTADHPMCDTFGSTFEADIGWLVSEGITTGCRPGRFCPTGSVTRGQVATFLWRLAGEPDPTVDVPFDDVSAEAFYFDPVRWMVENEFTTGTSPTTFDPDRPLNRAEFVTFLWRFAGRPEPETQTSFTDVDPAGFAADAIAWAAETSITKGTATTEFSPTAGATRGQAAAFLHRFALLGE